MQDHAQLQQLQTAPTPPGQTLIGPGWGRPVSELRPLWIAQLPAVQALTPYGNMRLGRIFKTLPEHPDSNRLDVEFLKWAKQSGLYDKASGEYLDRIKMGHIVKWVAPTTSLPVQWIIGTFLLWMIAMDDYWVEPGLPLTELKRACNDVIHSGASSLPLTPESSYWIELRRMLRERNAEGLIPQIGDEIQRLFMSNELEQRHNRADTLPTLIGYLKQRARNGAVNGPLLAQRCEEGLLPPSRYFCERLSCLGDLSTTLAGLDNDILGYRRDIETDYPVNIITVMSLEFRVDLATAYLMSLDLTDLIKYAMDVLVEDLCAYPGPYPEAAEQARVTAAWPHGWHTWTQNTPRYGVDDLTATAPEELLVSPPPPEQDWRTGPLLRALTGREHAVDADVPGTDLRELAMDAVATLFGRIPLWGSLAKRVAVPSLPAPEPEPSERRPELPDFPPSLTVRWEPYRNWSRTVTVDGVWVCEPRDTAEVVVLANWAAAQGFRLRASGSAYTFSPLTLTDEADVQRVVLVDTRAHLDDIRMVSTSPAAVRAGVGATMEALLTYLEHQGFGLATAPLTGEVTLGGVLATGSHGSSVRVPGQTEPFGHNHGILANLVVSLTAVVWDAARSEYIAQTFERSHPDCAALLVNLGRTFVTEATLRVGSNQILRCVSDVSSPAAEVFGPADVPSPRRFGSLVNLRGRVGVFWYPYNDRTWVTTWTPAIGPSGARPVVTPYNYPFMDSVPEQASDVVAGIMDGAPELAPTLSDLEYATVVSGLASSASADIVGLSKNVLLTLRSYTLRYLIGGYAICTRRADLQRVVHDFAEFYRTRLREYQDQGRFPVNGPLHIRASSIDSANGLDLPGARAAMLSPAAPNPDHPDWDVAVWIDLLNLPGTPYANQFYRELEAFLFSHYRPPYATVRIDWSKAWGYTDEGPYRNGAVLRRSYEGSWEAARSALSSSDPHGVFANDFLDHISSSS